MSESDLPDAAYACVLAFLEAAAEDENCLGQVASDLATADGYNPNEVPALDWSRWRERYLTLALAALRALAARQRELGQ